MMHFHLTLYRLAILTLTIQEKGWSTVLELPAHAYLCVQAIHALYLRQVNVS